MNWRTFLFLTVIGILLAACAPNQPTPTVAPILEAQIPESEIPRVSLEDAKAAFDTGSALFLDVRSKASYDAAHIPGALSIPLVELEERLAELDPNQWVITYCT